MTVAPVDTEVRLHLMERFLADGRPPSVAESAAALDATEGDVADAYRRLQDAHVIVLAPGSLDVWMANPLSAVPTPFPVETERGTYYANCIWDALGIPAMLGCDGTVAASCADCGDPLPVRIRNGEIRGAGGVAHFAVPARRWWDNIGHT
jgi:hypothetical protein